MIDIADGFGTDEASGVRIAQPRAVRDFSALMDAMERELRARAQPAACGKVQEVIGTLVRVSGLDATLGELCELRSPDGALLQRAEVVGFSRDVALLSPFGRLGSVSRATRVVGLRRPLSLRIGPRLLGRVIDSLGEPIDGKGPLECDEWQPVIADPPDPMSRPVVDTRCRRACASSTA